MDEVVLGFFVNLDGGVAIVRIFYAVDGVLRGG